MKLTLDPANGLIDDVPSFNVQGLSAGSAVALTIVTTDAAGHGWQSSGEYLVDESGWLNVRGDQPWWNMQYTDTSTAPMAFVAPESFLDYEVTITNGAASDTVVTRRTWGHGTSNDRLDQRWLLRSFSPGESDTPRPGVLIVPGSTGVAAVSPLAALVASHGYESAVLAYMQEDGLPENFQQIPIEAIRDGIASFMAQPEVDSAHVTVLAQSVGTAAALSALTLDDAPAVHSVILVAPSHVVWQALGKAGPPPKVSSLTKDGTDLPWVPIRGEKLVGQMLRHSVSGKLSRHPRSSALTMIDAYRGGLGDDEAVRKAGIAVEEIAAPMLIIAGLEDAMWPSADMAKAIYERRGSRDGDDLLLLPEAGHFLRPPATPSTVDRNESLVSGGTPTGIAAGQRSAWTAVLEFLQR